MKQIAWYGFQIAVFLGTGYVFVFVVGLPEEQGNYGLALLIICVGVTAIATALVFWTGRLLAWIGRATLGKSNEADHRRIERSTVIDRRHAGELPPRVRIGE